MKTNSSDEGEDASESRFKRYWHRLTSSCGCCGGQSDTASNDDADSSSSEDDYEAPPCPPNDRWRKDEYNPLSPAERAAVREMRKNKAQKPGTYVSGVAHRMKPGDAPRTPTQSHVLDVAPTPKASVSSDDADNPQPLLRRNSSVRFTEVRVVDPAPVAPPGDFQLSVWGAHGTVDPSPYAIPNDLVFSPASIG